MKQVVQHLRTGELSVADTPAPDVRRGTILVRTSASLISPGTERMVIDMAKRSWLGRARERPDLVRQVLRKLKADGPVATMRAVRARLDVPVPLGYSCAGTIVAVGDGVPEYRVGQRVACAGQGVASHAEFVVVPRQLSAPVPDGLSDEEAAFVTLGAIALHGVRVSEAAIGQHVGVYGLGIIGQLAAMILKAAGCQVLAFDPNPHRAAVAASFGLRALHDAHAFRDAIHTQSGGSGLDIALVAAAGGGASLLDMVAEACRDRAIVTMVGAVKLELPRRSFYEKELQLRMSRAYGPGRYDRKYEEEGIDYPIGFVRWTERRNFAEFLRLVSSGAVPAGRLITHRVPVADAPRAYETLADGSREPALGVVLTYPSDARHEVTVATVADRPAVAPSAVASGIALIGAGLFAQSVLLPTLKGRDDVSLAAVATRSGSTSRAIADRYGFAHASTSASDAMAQPGVGAVVVATRHDTHASLVADARRRGLAVFVEKPLAIDAAGLADVIAADGGENRVMVGFNRRWAAPSAALRDAFAGRSAPLVITYRVNAGAMPVDHWTRDPQVGGGRVIGEACHFVDLARWIVGAAIREVHAMATPDEAAEDSAVIALRFADGSLATVVYACGGDKTFPKERVEVIGGGVVAVLDDFHALTVVRGGRQAEKTFRGRSKGFDEEIAAFVGAVRSGGPMPVALAEAVEVTRATFAAVESIRTGRPVSIV